MEINTTKRLNSKLRKLTNQSTNEVTNVLIDEVEGNVIEEGSSLLEILESINYKANNSLLFTKLETDNLPSKNEYVQLVLKDNGELWCIPPLTTSKSSFRINGEGTGEYLNKKGIQYASGSNLEYYNINKGAKLFATQVRIGAIPPRVENTNHHLDGTYIEANNSGTINLYNAGKQCYKLNRNNALLKPNKSKIEIDEDDKISLYSNNMINIQGNTFKMKSNKTEVLETSDLTKFNCHTDLSNASYGNNKFRLQFYEDSLRIRNIETESDILTIYDNGSLVIGANYLKSLYNQLVSLIYNKTLLTDYVAPKIYYGLNQDESYYEFLFSDTANSQIMSIVIKGTDIDNQQNYYMPQTNSYYNVFQYIALDDSEDSYIEIRKVNSNGIYVATTYIRSLYLLNE